jgi:hypothetical protein
MRRYRSIDVTWSPDGPNVFGDDARSRGRQHCLHYISLMASLGIYVGHAAFDYQRCGNYITGFVQLRPYKDVSNFDAGLFCQQAGLSLNETLRSPAVMHRCHIDYPRLNGERAHR